MLVILEQSLSLILHTVLHYYAHDIIIMFTDKGAACPCIYLKHNLDPIQIYSTIIRLGSCTCNFVIYMQHIICTRILCILYQIVRVVAASCVIIALSKLFVVSPTSAHLCEMSHNSTCITSRVVRCTVVSSAMCMLFTSTISA